MENIASYIKSVGLAGATVKDVIQTFQLNMPAYFTANSLNNSPLFVCMPGNRYIHADNFVDMDEATETLSAILQRHFLQFGGYSNSRLLFNAASQELSMFLNDNDCANIEAVYAIARFLFEKKAVTGRPYKFYTPHIFEKEPNYPMNLYGLMIRLAGENGGILNANDAKNYLRKILLSYAGLNQLLQINSSKTFLMYDGENYLLSETIGIDDAWCYRLHQRLDDLFRKANVAYVIPRDINSAWLDTLPTLPENLKWTRLLLQEVLKKYSAVGFKSICADISQNYNTLAAAFVPIDSPLQSLPDVVTLFMQEHHQLPVRMSVEEFHSELREAGMVKGNELFFTMHKALNDYRFAWSNDNKTVYIRGNRG